MGRKKWEIDRRTFLRGFGLSLGLPFLEAMTPSVARALGAGNSPLPKLISMHYPLGYYNNSNNTLPSGLASKLSPILGDYTVVRGFFNENYSHVENGSLNGGHMINFIASRTGVAEYAAAKTGISFDQVIAQNPIYKGKRRFDSLNMSNFQHFGYTDAKVGPLLQEVSHNPSWAGPNKPQPISFQPRDIFDQLVGGGLPAQPDRQQAESLQGRRDVLHFVVDEIKALEKRLGKSDKETLDRYLTGIEELDKKTKNLQDQTNTTFQCSSIDRPKLYSNHTASNGSEMSKNYKERLKIFQDLIIMALECDATSVINFSYGAAFAGNIHMHHVVPGLEKHENGELRSWHTLSHYAVAKTATLQAQRKRNFIRSSEWIYGNYAQFVERIRNIQLPTGKTLLDDCGVILSSGMGNHKAFSGHPPTDLMAIIAGTAGGRLKKNHQITFPEYFTTPMANLWITLIQAYGINQESFGKGLGKSKGIVDGLRS